MNPKHSAFISGQLAHYAATLRYDDLPNDIRQLAHRVLLDTLGCAIAGAGTDEVGQIRRAMTQANAGGGDSLYCSCLMFAALMTCAYLAKSAFNIAAS